LPARRCTSRPAISTPNVVVPHGPAGRRRPSVGDVRPASRSRARRGESARARRGNERCAR
jgi:hypothetical protein